MGFQTYIFCSNVPSKCRKCRFRDPKFKKYPGEHAPGPPYNCVVTMASPSLKSWLRHWIWWYDCTFHFDEGHYKCQYNQSIPPAHFATFTSVGDAFSCCGTEFLFRHKRAKWNNSVKHPDVIEPATVFLTYPTHFCRKITELSKKLCKQSVALCVNTSICANIHSG